ncbi:MAG: fasciclin domain-containing protein [Rhodothermales bacterium]|nr:fasciclin domain-containing protein [Rhodothermales bacterium]MBO6780407.1 fasciclin domain-containing protein [Rhodothermales bacterium]
MIRSRFLSFTALAALFVFSADSLKADPNPPAHTITQIVQSDSRFSTLEAALGAAGLADVLSGDGPFTVFAPTNRAFRALPSGTLEALLRPENRESLQAVLTFHVIPGRVAAGDLLSTMNARTASGEHLPIGLSIEGARIIETDIEAENGIVHVIDAVLIPELPPLTSDRSSAREARSVIEYAIERGAPLYNAGNAAACAAIYSIAATSLLEGADLDRRARMALERGLERADRARTADDKAWRLREGLDEAYSALARRMMSESAGH